MITRIYIDNYRCFSNFTFEPKRMNLLVGGNGSGKSSLVDVITELRALVLRPDALREMLLPASRTRWDTRATQRFELQYADADGTTLEWVVTLAPKSPAATTNSVSKETVKKDGTVIAELEGGVTPTLQVRGREVAIPYELEGSLLSLRVKDVDLERLHERVVATNAFKVDVLNLGDLSEKSTTRYAGTARASRRTIAPCASVTSRARSSFTTRSPRSFRGSSPSTS